MRLGRWWIIGGTFEEVLPWAAMWQMPFAGLEGMKEVDAMRHLREEGEI